jgi:hypothetical protein
MTGFTIVTAAHLTDPSGAVIANGTIWFQPCDPQGKACNYRVFPSGQASSQPVSTIVNNGVFTIQLADASLTSPLIAYAVTVIDNATGNVLLGPKGYLIQPSGPAWDFDAFVPVSSAT